MYVYGRVSLVLVVRSPIGQCVIPSARGVSEIISATAWVWETIAVFSMVTAHCTSLLIAFVSFKPTLTLILLLSPR